VPVPVIDHYVCKASVMSQSCLFSALTWRTICTQKNTKRSHDLPKYTIRCRVALMLSFEHVTRTPVLPASQKLKFARLSSFLLHYQVSIHQHSASTHLPKRLTAKFILQAAFSSLRKLVPQVPSTSQPQHDCSVSVQDAFRVQPKRQENSGRRSCLC